MPDLHHHPCPEKLATEGKINKPLPLCPDAGIANRETDDADAVTRVGYTLQIPTEWKRTCK